MRSRRRQCGMLSGFIKTISLRLHTGSQNNQIRIVVDLLALVPYL